MQRWQGAALSAALCSGCLDPLVTDQAGYSRHLVPSGAAVQSVYDDPQLARKIDTNDGVGAGPLAVKTGFAAGSEVRYWELGPAKRAAVPAYLLSSCVDGRPAAPLAVHPPILDSIPGDTDYSPFRAIFAACVGPAYAGELITSIEALNDAVELKLVSEPVPLGVFRNWPVVNRGVDLSLGGEIRRAREAYYKGRTVQYHSFVDQEGEFPLQGSSVPSGYALEIVRPDAPSAPVKVIFSQPYRGADGLRNPQYTPQWIVVTVTLRAVDPLDQEALAQQNAQLASWTRDTDVVTYPSPNAVAKKEGTQVGEVEVTTTRVNRPFMVNEVAR